MSVVKTLEILYVVDVSLLIMENKEKCDNCVLVDMEATYAEYGEWSEQGVPETVTHLYKKASQEMEKRKSLEESLVPDLHE